MLARALDPIPRMAVAPGLVDRLFGPESWGRVFFPVAGALVADVGADAMGADPVLELVAQATLATVVLLLIHFAMAMREQRRAATPIQIAFSIVTPTPPLPAGDLRDATTFRNDIVKLTDLLEVAPRITNRVFEDCDIIGPAVIWVRRASLEDCTIRDDGQTILLHLENERPPAGAIVVEDCQFVRCRFHNLGIAGPAEHLQRFRARFTPAHAGAD